MNTDEKYMEECLLLARKGEGKAEPNPLVGCVLVKNGKLIGRGYHKKYGSHHAEVNAIINSIKNGHNPKGSTLYVNLEPCNHFGKTPPCTEFIISHGIKKVVIGMRDPNPEVKGNGIIRLKKAGIEVKTGILKNECSDINSKFIVNVQEKRPYITIKVAQSVDGKIALNNFKSQWITSIESRRLAHIIRSKNDCILIGKNTVLHDNPELTVRHVKTGKNPVRIVIDKDLKLTGKYKIIKNSPPLTLVYHSSNKKVRDKEFTNYRYLKPVKGKLRIADLVKDIYKLGYASMLVEGGANIYSQFVKYTLFDELQIFLAPKIIGDGISAFKDFQIDKIDNSRELILKEIKILNKDLVLIYKKS